MNKLFSIIVFVSMAFGLSSCLKDDEHFVDFAGAGYVAEIPYTANRSLIKSFPVSLAKASVDTVIDVNIASPNPPSMDIPITLGVDQAALTTYNAGSKTKYTLLPADAYKIASTTITVLAGKRIANLQLSFIPAKVPTTGGPYALPITIQTVPSNVTISANYKTQIATISLTK
jgi:hypothetical protein